MAKGLTLERSSNSAIINEENPHIYCALEIWDEGILDMRVHIPSTNEGGYFGLPRNWIFPC